MPALPPCSIGTAALPRDGPVSRSMPIRGGGVSLEVTERWKRELSRTPTDSVDGLASAGLSRSLAGGPAGTGVHPEHLAERLLDSAMYPPGQPGQPGQSGQPGPFQPRSPPNPYAMPAADPARRAPSRVADAVGASPLVGPARPVVGDSPSGRSLDLGRAAAGPEPRGDGGGPGRAGAGAEGGNTCGCEAEEVTGLGAVWQFGPSVWPLGRPVGGGKQVSVGG
jgi:hypothetical protein